MQNTYNGWTNRETWLVTVWFSPKNKEDLEMIRDMLEDEYHNMPNGILKDMVDLGEINWNELFKHLFGEE